MNRYYTRPSVSAPADDWCASTAIRMAREGCAVDAIISYLNAYGCGLCAAQRLASDATTQTGA